MVATRPMHGLRLAQLDRRLWVRRLLWVRLSCEGRPAAAMACPARARTRVQDRLEGVG